MKQQGHFSWRHTCISVDFAEGIVMLVENGEKIFEKHGVEEIRTAFEQNKKEMDIISVGLVLSFVFFNYKSFFARCIHKAGGSSMMSLNGRVSRVQNSWSDPHDNPVEKRFCFQENLLHTGQGIKPTTSHFSNIIFSWVVDRWQISKCGMKFFRKMF